MAQTTAIKFGTDGWRGIIADDFTFDNVRIAASAVANYLHASTDPKEAVSKGICIGYDTRFASDRFARAVAEVVAASGIPIKLASRITPTPALSYAVRELGAAGGVMITSSHNPFQWNGVKYKAWYGGSGKPSIISAIESHLADAPIKAATPASIEEVDFVPAYVDAIKKFVDLDLIAKAGKKFAIDCMYGAGAGIISAIFTEIGVNHIQIRAEHDPLFPGINPEPIEPHIIALEEAVVANKCDAGLATDGDADRIGAADEHGNFVDPHKIYAVLLEWLLKRKGWPGDITRAFNTTLMLDRIAAKYGRTLHEHGIGFKFVCDLMLEKDILIGGEESGGIGISRHLPERDGLLNSLLLANVMAEEGKTLGELVADLQAEYGEHQYGRIDLHIPDDIKNAAIARARAGVKEFAGMAVEHVETLDGIKFFLDNPEAKTKPNAAKSWLLLRASGTEPLMRIYSESCSKESVQKLLEAGRKFALES
ncbi:phosphoglucomutase/phosphomannomutase family protein [Silvibacterium dinghuense]|uniref:Phosphoglucomutase/phosphomannomutase family protein n=1 Tax=Silvibacterium dinghuense TaxID=1560006 RepID=A0A4Q1SHD9_9BACT|nr:phosphoglucomutase/phosphomannomutase family protein [Silvibacterium dinghuense]RXS96590.1 phosphoglucomutase/phosphomannomutase family protein [Silvibacterium dinghuense]GGG92056.1 phosphoesterase [Silvibacterium dinghuense]